MIKKHMIKKWIVNGIFCIAIVMAGSGCGTKEVQDTVTSVGVITENKETEVSKDAIEQQGASKEEEVNTTTVNTEVERVYTSECVGVINISINPEIEFEVNEQGEVAAVIYKNEDASKAYSDLQLEGAPIEEAIGSVVQTADEKGYLKDGNDVTLNYGSTGYATAEESMELINSARDAVVSELNDSGKDSAVVLNVSNYVQGETTDTCDLCYGVGSIVCESCGGVSYGNGMVKCDLCLGSGYYDDGHKTGGDEQQIRDGSDGADPEGACRHCHGTGIKTIQAQTCYICHGTGRCINCGGSGIDPEPDDQGNFGSCHACGGSGDCLQQVCEGGIMPERHETCDACGGTGIGSGDDVTPQDQNEPEVDPGAKPDGTCYRCDGAGYMRCNQCDGTLMATCYRCNGTGIHTH